MRNGATIRSDTTRANGAALDLCADYAPDDERQARALLLIMGRPADEIERVVSEITFDSDREM